jgi:K+ transporter
MRTRQVLARGSSQRSDQSRLAYLSPCLKCESLLVSVADLSLFVIVDLWFVTANMMKVLEGRLGAARGRRDAVLFAMSTWRQGVVALAKKLARDTTPLKEFIAGVHPSRWSAIRRQVGGGHAS